MRFFWGRDFGLRDIAILCLWSRKKPYLGAGGGVRGGRPRPQTVLEVRHVSQTDTSELLRINVSLILELFSDGPPEHRLRWWICVFYGLKIKGSKLELGFLEPAPSGPQWYSKSLLRGLTFQPGSIRPSLYTVYDWDPGIVFEEFIARF